MPDLNKERTDTVKALKKELLMMIDVATAKPHAPFMMEEGTPKDARQSWDKMDEAQKMEFIQKNGGIQKAFEILKGKVRRD